MVDAGESAARHRRYGIHGITPTDVYGATTMTEIAGPVVDLLRGRVTVAHNARFDLSSLDGVPVITEAAFERLFEQYCRSQQPATF